MVILPKRAMQLFLLLLLLITGTACQPDSANVPAPIIIIPSTYVPFSYLALGDSYTIGQSVPETQRFPRQLADSLLKQQVTLNPVTVIARTGWTTGDLLSRLDQEPPQGIYALVTLLIGVNNQYQGLSLSNYERELRQLFDRAITYAGGDRKRVIIISIPDYGVTPFGQGTGRGAAIGREIDQFNGLKQQVAAEYGFTWINITPISLEAATDQSLVASDGLHPSGKMYQRWVELLVPVVLTKLTT